jgi:hypothetical protein
VAAPAVAPTGRGTPAGTIALYVTGPLVAVLLALALAVVLARRGLRRRRLATVDGAWLEVVDALRLAGRPAPAHLSATEVAAPAATAHPATAHAATAHAADNRATVVRPPLPPIDDLADAVNRGAFAPSAHTGQPTAAATQATAYIRSLRAAQPCWRRLLWTVHPGPLRWQRRRRSVIVRARPE